MRMNKKAVSPVIAVMLLVAVAVAAVGAYFIWYKSFQAGSQKQVEEQTGTIGSKLGITNITNDNVTFYVTIKNATGKDLGYFLGSPGDQQSEITITIKDDQGNLVGEESETVGAAVAGNSSAKFTGVTPPAQGAFIEMDDEGQIEFRLTTGETQPGETYTIIITASGTTSTVKYTAI